jgi:lipoprotein-anchoring transpeptidase ErfK/SrfK
MTRRLVLFVVLAVLPDAFLLAGDLRVLSSTPAPRSLAESVPKRAVAPPVREPELTEAEKLQQFQRDWVASFDIEGLPHDAPREGALITVDTATNTLYLFKDGQLVHKAPAATGMDKMLKDGDREWLFRTPRGIHPVQKRVADPVWFKPDWAYIEEKKKVPPRDSKDRLVKGKLGKYALDLGDGIMIHGTDDPASIGKKVSHGCIRLGNKMLNLLWKEAAVGTPVYIF